MSDSDRDTLDWYARAVTELSRQAGQAHKDLEALRNPSPRLLESATIRRDALVAALCAMEAMPVAVAALGEAMRASGCTDERCSHRWHQRARKALVMATGEGS